MKSNNLRTEQRAKATTINTATTATTTKIVELNIRVHLCTEDKNTKKKNYCKPNIEEKQYTQTYVPKSQYSYSKLYTAEKCETRKK